MKARNIYDYILYFFLGVIIISLAFFIFYTVKENKVDIQNNAPLESKENTPLENKENTPPPAKEEKEIVEEETELISYSTEIIDKTGNRIYNIKLASSKLQDKIIQDGEVFSFNDTVGKMGEKEGYKKAEAFKQDGSKYLEFGGGICQVSSTLYNCVLDSGLEVIERHPHSRRVYYVPRDRDATIYYGHKDLKFKNNTGNKLKIKVDATDTSLKITLNKIIQKEK